MRVLDGIRILGSDDGTFHAANRSTLRELVGAVSTDHRWRLGEVIAEPDESVGTHVHPGEPEAIVILEGNVELHGASGVAHLHAGDVVFIPPDTEHGLRTPTGGRWLAIWPIGERVPGPRYAAASHAARLVPGAEATGMEKPMEVAAALYAALEADDVALVLALCGDAVEVVYPADGALEYGGSWRGPEGAARFLDAHDAAEEILEFDPGAMVADGDTVIVRGHFRGRDRATGREWSTDFVHVLTVTGGRLARWQAFFDTAAAAAARGTRATGDAAAD